MNTAHHVEYPTSRQAHDDIASKRLDDVGWGLLLVITGVIWLFPEERVPTGTWLICIGALLILLNGVRYLKGIGLSGVTMVLGGVALIAGLGSYFGVQLPVLAIGFIVIGAAVVLKPARSDRSQG